MNVSYRRSMYTMFLFGFLFFFLFVYFMIIGPAAYLDNKIHFGINALAIFFTMAGFATMLLLTKKKENIIDERDSIIQTKATSVGLLLTSMYVFLLCITLFVINENEIYIHVSWLWFIAYTTFAFAYFSCSLLNVYYYNKDK